MTDGDPDETPAERAEREAEEHRWQAEIRWTHARADARNRLVFQYHWSEAGANKFLDIYDRQVKDEALKTGTPRPSFEDYWRGFWERADLTRWDKS